MSLIRTLVVLILLSTRPALAADWPHQRGPGFDGRVDAPGTFDGESIGLETAWRVPLGSGYSGIAIAGERAVTMFASGDADWIAAFDAASGRELWRKRLGDLTKGRDGADDGPLSSPVIAGDRIFALSPGGELNALRLSDGESLWRKKLDTEFGAKGPSFGFATIPLLEGNLLVLQAGGPQGRSVVGLDSTNGKTLWSSGDDKVDYQSPVLMTLGGERQIVAATQQGIAGLSTKDGTPLWTHRFEDGTRATSTQPTFVGEDRFLAYMSGGAAVFKVSRTETGWTVAELYRSETLGGNYAPPVYRDGYAYGFRGNGVLTCMDLANGERVWRSRPPGGDGLILVDGHLVIFGAKGVVAAAKASPEGYREIAQVQALDGSGLTWPSFADGRIFVRNLDEMTAIRVTRNAAAPATRPAAPDGGDQLGNWIKRLATAQNPGAEIARLFEQRKSWPVVEGDFVHFVYRGDAEDVSIVGSMNDSESAEPMQRVAGTDLFHRAYRLEPGARWEYAFQVDFKDPIPDPLNPISVPAVEGDERYSELVTAGYRSVSNFDPPEGPRGTVEQLTLGSKLLGTDKAIRVWRPAGYDGSTTAYPLLIVSDGENWIERGRMTEALDNLAGKGARPLVVAFVPASPQWWEEAGGSKTAEYARMLAEELLPTLRQRYRLQDEPSSRALMGNRFYALSALYGALKYPDAFGGVAIQSIYLGLGAGDEVTAMLRGRTAPALRVYLDWNRFDERNIDRGYDFAEDSRTVSGLLSEGGYKPSGGEMLDSKGWSGWRNRLDLMLSALFPLKP